MTSLANRCIAHISSSANSYKWDRPCAAEGAQWSPGTASADDPGGGSRCSAPRPLPPGSLPRAVPCHGEPETPATAGSSRWPFPIQALPVYFYTYQASYACKWRWGGVGGNRFLPSEQPACPARRVKVPLSEMPLHVRVIELPSCMPLNVLIFSYCSQSRCLHKALNFTMLLTPSEFLPQKEGEFKLHLFDIYKTRENVWVQISWPFHSSDSYGISCRYWLWWVCFWADTTPGFDFRGAQM